MVVQNGVRNGRVEILLDRIKLGLRLSLMSLGSDGGIPIHVGQTEVRHKWRNIYDTIQYNGD